MKSGQLHSQLSAIFLPAAAAAALLLPGLVRAETPAVPHVPDSGKEYIWLEAESATRQNFPPLSENPYRAQAFWESDLLSGGEWVGQIWKEGAGVPFFEFDFDVPSDGLYSLYARKFQNLGNFRWRVDGGEWMDPVPAASHLPLETVPMRETAERMSLGWYYMGRTAISKGRHTLRVEFAQNANNFVPNPVTGYPMAYDAFLLTRDLFVPRGKLKPGEAYPLRDERAFAFQPPIDPFLPAALDLRELNEMFAGERGGIVAQDGRLVYADTKEPVRLVGVNYALNRNISPEALEYFARFLAKRGINFVRFELGAITSFAKEPGGKLEARISDPLLANLPRLVNVFRNHGIYIALAWNLENSPGFRKVFDPLLPPANAIPQVFDNSPGRDVATLLIFDPEVRAAFWKTWEKVLALDLSDGSKLGENPALFLITILQQASLLNLESLQWEQLPADTREAMTKAWQDWVAAKYGSMEKAVKAWKIDDPAAANTPPGIGSIIERRDALAKDGLRFLAETQQKFLADAVARFRNLGYSGLISCSNQSSSRPDLLGLAEMQTRTTGDVTERHGALLTDFVPTYTIWQFYEGSMFADRSLLRLDSRKGQTAARFELPFKAPRYDNMPSLLTELGNVLPNRYSGELPIAAFTLSSLQGVDAIGFSLLDSENWQVTLGPSRIPVLTPGVLGQMPAFAYAYRKGLLPGPVSAGRYETTADAAFSLNPALVPEAPDSQLTAKDYAMESAGGAPDPALWITGAVEIRQGAKSEKFEKTGAGTVSAEGVIEAAEGAMRWDPRRRLFMVNAPGFQAAAGALRDAGAIRLGAVEIRSPMESGVIALVSLDGQPLDFSRKILVQIFSEEFNTGFNAQKAGEMSVIRSSGRPPLLVRAMSGEINFLRPDADELVATALDANLSPLVPAGLGASLRLLPSTMYYLVEK